MELPVHERTRPLVFPAREKKNPAQAGCLPGESLPCCLPHFISPRCVFTQGMQKALFRAGRKEGPLSALERSVTGDRGGLTTQACICDQGSGPNA